MSLLRFLPWRSASQDRSQAKSRLKSEAGSGTQTDIPPQLPYLSAPVAVVGDIHGRADLLIPLLERLAHYPDASSMRVLIVGDMIDRGPASANVLADLFALDQSTDPFANLTCLMGNHEAMMLAFLDDPEAHGPRWLRHGGADTLLSFGLDPYRRPPSGHDGGGLRALASEFQNRLESTVGTGAEAWLRGLPLYWRDGGLVVSHAGADPRRPVEGQTADTLIWGHRDFLHQPRQDTLWFAHGHWPMETGHMTGARIATDTGAWKTGRLTAAIITRTNVDFETVQA